MWTCKRAACPWNDGKTFWAEADRLRAEQKEPGNHMFEHIRHMLIAVARIESRMIKEHGVTIEDMAAIERVVKDHDSGA